MGFRTLIRVSINSGSCCFCSHAYEIKFRLIRGIYTHIDVYAGSDRLASLLWNKELVKPVVLKLLWKFTLFWWIKIQWISLSQKVFQKSTKIRWNFILHSINAPSLILLLNMFLEKSSRHLWLFPYRVFSETFQVFENWSKRVNHPPY